MTTIPANPTAPKPLLTPRELRQLEDAPLKRYFEAMRAVRAAALEGDGPAKIPQATLDVLRQTAIDAMNELARRKLGPPYRPRTVTIHETRWIEPTSFNPDTDYAPISPTVADMLPDDIPPILRVAGGILSRGTLAADGARSETRTLLVERAVQVLELPAKRERAS